MKFLSLGELSRKQLFQYAIIGIGLGGILNTIFNLGPIIGLFVGAISLLGWICLIWAIFKKS